MSSAPASTEDFLKALFGSAAQGVLVVWSKGGGSSFHLVSELAAAAADIQTHAPYSDVYFGLGLQPRPLTSSQRGKADDVVGVAGLWFDFDFRNPDAPDAHSKKDELPQFLEEVLEFITQLPLKPTCLVHTGNGAHAYWLFPGVWDLTKGKDRQRAQRLSKDWQNFVRAKAKERGWQLDNTADLSRVLRAPGSRNHKNSPPAEVKILEWTGHRYEVVDFEAAISSSKPTTQDRPRPGQGWGTASIDPILDGCAWLRHCRDKAALLSEPSWYAMLSIIGRCENGEALAHEFSRPYPGYTFEETEKKLKQAIDKAGPRTCHNIRYQLDGEPYCSKCPNWGRIRSPIALGLKASDLVNRYAYVVGTKQFLEMATGARYDRRQFSDLYLHRLKKDPATTVLRSTLLTKAEGLTYSPNDPLLLEKDGKLWINTWRGGGVIPVSGDVAPFLEHMAYLIDNEAALRHVLDWLAHCLQRPKIRINHAILLQGPQGIGKTFVAQLMEPVLGAANVNYVSTADLIGSFNSWLAHRQLVVIEELMASNRLETANLIEPYLTQESVLINEKHIPKHTVPNLANFIIFTNHRNSIYLEDGDRRFFVWFSNATHRSKDYYDKLFGWLKENAGAVAHYLLNRDISGFNPKAHPPLTPAKLEMIERSLPPLEEYLKSAIDAAEEFPFNRELITIGMIRVALPRSLRDKSDRAIADALRRIGAEELARIIHAI